MCAKTSSSKTGRKSLSGLSGLKLFFSLSRTPHALLDMATPGLAALLCLGAFPSPRITLLGLVTVFAGYTSVYALNDVMDHRADEKKVRRGGFRKSDDYLDGVLVRHPIAQGLLPFKHGLLWVLIWGLLALAGAYALNPVCAWIFLGGSALEAVYCMMWRTSPLRTLVSGAVKTSGGMAAVFAVDPGPSVLFLLTLFAWLYFWEIGGQNVPADWTDIEEDMSLKAQTIPVRFGPETASRIILATLTLSVVLSAMLFLVSPIDFSVWYRAFVLCIGVFFLLLPAYRLHRNRDRHDAVVLFNWASYYPLALLAVVSGKLLV